MSLIAPASSPVARPVNGVVYPTTSSNAPAFFAPLKSSLLPLYGVGSYTFTRASAAHVLDHEGIVRKCKVGEPRFSRARRIENLVGDGASEDLTNAWWSTFGSAGVYVDGPNTLRFDQGVGGNGIWNAAPLGTVGRTYTLSVTISANIDSQINLYIGSNLQLVSASTNPRRFAHTFTLANPSDRYFGFTRVQGAPATTFTIDEIQVEEVTDQINQAPGEYASTMAGAEYGTNVVGVRCETTTNGNSVDANGVVSEGTGSGITHTMGYTPIGNRTNIIAAPQNPADGSWIKVNVNPVAGSTFLAGFVGYDIKNTSGSNVRHEFGGTYPATAGASQAIVMHAKAGVNDHAYIEMSSGGNSAYQFFNLATGQLGSSGAVNYAILAAYMVPVKNGYMCVTIVDCGSDTSLTARYGSSNADNVLSYAESGGAVTLMTANGFMAIDDMEHVEAFIEGTVAFDDLQYDPTNLTDRESTIIASLYRPLYQHTTRYVYWIEQDSVNHPRLDLSMVASTGNVSVQHHRDTDTFSRIFRDGGAPAFGIPITVGYITSDSGGGVRKVAINGEDVTEPVPPIDVDEDTIWTWNKFYVGHNAQTYPAEVPIWNIQIWNEPLKLAQVIHRTK